MKLEWQIRVTIWLAQFIDSDANTTKVPWVPLGPWIGPREIQLTVYYPVE